MFLALTVTLSIDECENLPFLPFRSASLIYLSVHTLGFSFKTQPREPNSTIDFFERFSFSLAFEDDENEKEWEKEDIQKFLSRAGVIFRVIQLNENDKSEEDAFKCGNWISNLWSLCIATNAFSSSKDSLKRTPINLKMADFVNEEDLGLSGPTELYIRCLAEWRIIEREDIEEPWVLVQRKPSASNTISSNVFQEYQDDNDEYDGIEWDFQTLQHPLLRDRTIDSNSEIPDEIETPSVRSLSSSHSSLSQSSQHTPPIFTQTNINNNNINSTNNKSSVKSLIRDDFHYSDHFNDEIEKSSTNSKRNISISPQSYNIFRYEEDESEKHPSFTNERESDPILDPQKFEDEYYQNNDDDHYYTDEFEQQPPQSSVINNPQHVYSSDFQIDQPTSFSVVKNSPNRTFPNSSTLKPQDKAQSFNGFAATPKKSTPLSSQQQLRAHTSPYDMFKVKVSGYKPTPITPPVFRACEACSNKQHAHSHSHPQKTVSSLPSSPKRKPTQQSLSHHEYCMCGKILPSQPLNSSVSKPKTRKAKSSQEEINLDFAKDLADELCSRINQLLSNYQQKSPEKHADETSLNRDDVGKSVSVSTQTETSSEANDSDSEEVSEYVKAVSQRNWDLVGYHSEMDQTYAQRFEQILKDAQKIQYSGLYQVETGVLPFYHRYPYSKIDGPFIVNKRK